MASVFSDIMLLASENHGYFTTADAQRMGYTRAYLSQLVKKGRLERVGHGQYCFPGMFTDELFLLGQRSDKIIFSHETALFLHGLSERTPFQHSITLPSGSSIRNSDGLLKVYHIKPELHSLGAIEVSTKAGQTVPCYNVERTICDILRSRNRMDDQMIREALRRFISLDKGDFEKLRQYAQLLRVTKVLRNYTEALV